MFNKIKNIFINSGLDIISEKNLDIYINFCLENNDTSLDVGSQHHILPKAKNLPFSKYSDLKLNTWNASRLSYKNHFITHYLLYKSINHISIISSFYAMNNKDIKNNRLSKEDILSPEEYQLLMENFILSISENNKKIIKYNGKPMTKKEASIIKQKETMSKIDENGLTRYQNIAIKAAKTMSIICDDTNLSIRQKATMKMLKTKSIKDADGLSIHQKTAMRGLETKIKNNTVVRGPEINTARKIAIYDKNNTLVAECNGTFFTYCENNNIPSKMLYRTLNNTVFNFDINKEKNILEKMKFDGHYIKLKDNIHILYNNYNEIIGEHKTFLGLIRTFTDNNAVYQYLAGFFRNNKTVKIPTAQKIYLTYKEFDGWYARYLD